jgi:hypothetical protein
VSALYRLQRLKQLNEEIERKLAADLPKQYCT